MDFFARQDQARRSTKWLVVLFVLAVLALIAGTDAVAYVLLLKTHGNVPPRADELAGVLGIASLATLAVIGLGSLYKTWSLRRGGEAVAGLMGGTLLDGSRADGREKVLLNVVEEMALASGVPVPRVFVMREESGINAFAAGFGRDDAVIAVTQGCLDSLNRDELQGVIGHEFSHLLNGDMRLNIRLIGILNGILVIYLIGRIVLDIFGRGRVRRRDDKDNGAAVVLLIGLALMILGSLGLFFGRLIKAAVSRQREFLADASAVQFTRNPSGIANALKKIGASYSHARIERAQAEEVSHLFIGQARSSLFGWYSTHPPIERRIRAIEPDWDGQFPRLELQQQAPEQPAKAVQQRGQRFLLNAMTLPNLVGTVTPKHVEFSSALIRSFPPQLEQATHETFSARAVVAAVMLDDDGAAREQQLKKLERFDQQLVETMRALYPHIAELGIGAHLPLIELCVPALKALSDMQRSGLQSAIRLLIDADQRLSMREYTLFKFLRTQLLPAAPPVVRFNSMTPVLPHALVILSTIAYAGHADPAKARAVFAGAAAHLSDGFTPDMCPETGCTPSSFDQALEIMRTADGGIKRRFLTACAHCVAADGTVTVQEAELLRILGASLDCPLPPFLT